MHLNSELRYILSSPLRFMGIFHFMSVCPDNMYVFNLIFSLIELTHLNDQINQSDYKSSNTAFMFTRMKRPCFSENMN